MGAKRKVAELDQLAKGERRWSGLAVSRLTRGALVLALVTANLVGTAIVFGMAAFVVPLPDLSDATTLRTLNGILAAAYFLVGSTVGIALGSKALDSIRGWLAEERPPTEEEQLAVLVAPRRLFVMQASMWMVAAIVFGLINAAHNPELGTTVFTVTALAGLTVSAVAYLLAERILRAAAARALSEGPPPRRGIAGLAPRLILAWALGTAVPILGLLIIGLTELFQHEATAVELAWVMIALGSVALAIGLLVAVFAARAAADPVRSLRSGLDEVEHGNLDAELPVYDGTEIGLLQAGFNRMVAGLRERERIREAFGTYVDPDVAEHILSEKGKEGEQVEVTVMFVDVRDFTGFAERAPAPEVVRTLNRLFELIVPIVHRHGGHVDKFVGDGLLAVFGAPRVRSDHANQALLAATEIAKAVRKRFGDSLEVGIGLNSGTVVAGNIGGAGRLDFSVIGDVVNIAARVESATRETGDDVLVAERTRRLVDNSGIQFAERPGIELKGKSSSTRLYAPVDGD